MYTFKDWYSTCSLKKTLLIVLLLVLAGLLNGCISPPKWECHTIQEVLKCGEEECRVLLTSGKRATIHDVVVPGDRVHIWTEYMSGDIRYYRCPQQ